MSIDNKQCIECGKPANEAHHIIPIQFGGKATVPLCAECHKKAHSVGFGLRRSRWFRKNATAFDHILVPIKEMHMIDGLLGKISSRKAEQITGINYMKISRHWNRRSNRSRAYDRFMLEINKLLR